MEDSEGRCFTPGWARTFSTSRVQEGYFMRVWLQSRQKERDQVLPLKPHRWTRCARSVFFWHFYLGVILLLFNVLSGIISAPLANAAPAITLTGSPSTPNKLDPTAGSTSLTHVYKPGAPGTQKPGTPQTIMHGFQMPMQAGSIDLQVNQATRFIGSDGRLELQIPAGAISVWDLAQAGGKISLHVIQIAPASGSNAGGTLSLGTYLIQLQDAHGALLTYGLLKPISAKFHIHPNELSLGLEHVYALFNGGLSAGVTAIKGMIKPARGTSLASTMGTFQRQRSALDIKAQTLTVTPLIATPSTSLSWNSDAPIASFGKPNPFSTDLSSGSLTSSEPITIPSGPGGLTPPVNLTYSSEAVNEQHSYSSAASWVGEGWNLSLGEISWNQHNVVAGCTPQPSCGSNWQNQWSLNDPYGTSSELIPPNFTASTYYDATANNACQLANPSVPCPILWHTATESHAKIYAYIGNISIPGQTINPVCWRVWLSNGIMEEFGCTSDSLQYFYVPGGHAEVSGWYLDMITDPQGNQIHATYQRDMENWTDPSNGTVHSYPRDVQMSAIQYDSPGCLNAQTMCTGSTWAPQMQVIFNASHSPSLTGTAPSGCNTGSNLRCDDPLDLSGSGGTSAPLIQSTYVLNSIQTQVRTSGTGSWNALNTYQMTYEQSGPTTITDPASGLSVSVAGMLDLTQLQERGSLGGSSILYSGKDNNATTSHAYVKAFDLSSQNITVGPDTALSYWVFPQSTTNNNLVSGSNSTCVAIDMVFTDGSDLRDSGAVDQYGNQLHPAHQCGHLTLDQWNLVTSVIGAKVSGKTINRINVGYDQPANTGGYRGYIDDIALINPTSSTPLFTTDLESGSTQLTWTNTIDTANGGISNVGGICCSLTGPELWSGQQSTAHTDTAAFPTVIFNYTTQTNYYEDSFFKPNPSTNCGPSWNTGNGSGCLLWEQSHVNNGRFLSSVSNGQGLSQSFNWTLARNNSHGVPGGGSNNADPLYCNAHQTGYPCNEADDSGWSHVVLLTQSATTVRLTQHGQDGTNTPLAFHGANDGNWSGNVQTLNVTVHLRAGNNTIQLTNASGWSPNLDRITVGGQSYEAEASINTLAGGAAVATCSTCSGTKMVGFLGNGGTLQFNNVNAASSGSYTLTLSFIDGDTGRAAQMLIDETNLPITATTGYTYHLTYPLPAQECSDCVAGMYWGDQNNNNYLNYYNSVFMGFAQTTVNEPSGASEVHKFYAGEGWGVYDTSQVTCFTTAPCHNDPWWDLANTVHGHEYQTLSYDADGTTLLSEVDTTYQAICPPTGVSPTPPSGSITWDGKLISDLDHNNPVVVCDIQQTQQVNKTYSGSSSSVTSTTNLTYDSYGRVTQETTTTNGGTPANVVKNTSYIWNDNITATSTSASGTYILNTVAFVDTEDGSGNRLSCSYTSYNGQSYATGQSSALTTPLATSATSYSDCGTSSNGYTPSGSVTTTSTYNSYGNVIGSIDADANAGLAGHTGCSVSSTQYTTCSTYDSTFDAFQTAASNALNQRSSTSYANSGALFGYGTWPVSATDANGQTTSYVYDSLGRMTSAILPGETPGLSTKQWSYTNWCSSLAAQIPCEEIDEIDRLTSSTTTTTRAFYNGDGHLVETRAPGPGGQDVVIYATYDTAGRQIFKSNPYFVTGYAGTPGVAAYSIPDDTQPGISNNYYPTTPNLRTVSVTDPNSHTNTTKESVICGVPGTSDTGCYTQTIKLDANGHEMVTLAGGLGKVNYLQRYTGSSTYTLYATVTTTYDAAGRLLSTVSPDGSTTTAIYNNLGHVTSQSDPDRGTTTLTYDPNGNLTESIDARGSSGTIFVGYDGLNRPLWRNTTNSPGGAWVTYTYDNTVGGNNGIGQMTGESFTGSGGLSGSYAYVYDARGQQTTLTLTVNGTSYPIQASYNDTGTLTNQTYPTGEIVTPGYDASGWQTGLTTQSGSTVTTLASNLVYTGLAGASGQITAMNLDNGTYSYSASYDTGIRLTSASWTNTSTSTLLYETQPSYDAANNVVSVQMSLSGSTDIQQFCYDDLNRLTWSGTSGTPPCSGVNFSSGTLAAAQYQQSVNYNADGGLTTGPHGIYTYGDSSHPHAATSSSNGYSAAYNAVGDLTCRAPTGTTTCSGTQTGQQLSYDAEERLATWQDQPGSPTSTASYLYDGAGNRVAQQTTVNGTTTLTAYIGSVEEVQTTSSTTQTTTYYTVGGKRVAASVNGTHYYFGYDALGSQVMVLNAGGSVVGSQLYGPYGSSRYTTGTLPTSIGFTGQQADSVTGLDYYVARYYDPVLGQFLSADTVQGNPQGMDPYVYVDGNPETANDPTGHCSSIFDLSCDVQTVGSWLGDAGSWLGDTGGWLGEAGGWLGEAIGTFAEEWAGPIGWVLLAGQVINAVFNPPKLGCGCITPSQAQSQSNRIAYPGGMAVSPQKQQTSSVLHKIRSAAKSASHADAGKNKEKRDRQNYGGAYLQLGEMVNGVFVPVAGFISPPLLAFETDYHVEDQATDWAIAMIQWYNSQPDHKPVTAVRLDIYTFQPPCDLCSGYYHRNDGYAVDIMEHVPTIVNAEVTIWTSDGINGDKAPITPAK